jgi:1-acyl-sn-glycerol-3-phosphate acyltransferase
MFYFIWYFIWYFTLVPIGLLVIYPFHKIGILEYGRYCFKELKLKSNVIKESEYIKEGFILANHRCYFDFYWDPFISQGSIVGRRLAFLLFLFPSIYLYLNTGIIIINRCKDRREDIFKKMIKYKRVLFYPEGTRLRYTTLDSVEDIKRYLRYGILKEIYNYNTLPVQLQITSNKELVIDERKLKINKGVTVKTFISSPIYPADFENEQDFYNEIADKWFKAWKYTHVT